MQVVAIVCHAVPRVLVQDHRQRRRGPDQALAEGAVVVRRQALVALRVAVHELDRVQDRRQVVLRRQPRGRLVVELPLEVAHERRLVQRDRVVVDQARQERLVAAARHELLEALDARRHRARLGRELRIACLLAARGHVLHRLRQQVALGAHELLQRLEPGAVARLLLLGRELVVHRLVSGAVEERGREVVHHTAALYDHVQAVGQHEGIAHGLERLEDLRAQRRVLGDGRELELDGCVAAREAEGGARRLHDRDGGLDGVKVRLELLEQLLFAEVRGLVDGVGDLNGAEGVNDGFEVFVGHCFFWANSFYFLMETMFCDFFIKGKIEKYLN